MLYICDHALTQLCKRHRIDFEGLFEGEKNDLVESLPEYTQYQSELDQIEDLLDNLQLNA